MNTTSFHDVAREINELRNQLSYTKRIGFFLGAGTSKSLGISDISELTSKVRSELTSNFESTYNSIDSDLENLGISDINIEDILNQTRLIRNITRNKEDRNYKGVSGKDAKELDIKLCNKIYEILIEEQDSADLNPLKRFVSWVNWLSRDFSKDIFTTNYDLLLEKALESTKIPFFDGFIGADEPFFVPESLEKYRQESTPPTSWIKLWKLHGSLGWFWKHDDGNNSRIIRLGGRGKVLKDYEEIVIYPSREKYESSRKQPFISYFDRLKLFLQSGEGVFIINGYSFSDDHINSIIFDGIKQNNRLHVIGFFYDDSVLEKINEMGNTYYNFSAYGPNKAIISGVLGEWKKENTNNLLNKVWDEDESALKLGDFKELIDFLLLTSGDEETILSRLEENE
ncbi:SIR2 family protein [Aliifodinibius sp. S!AR15-10]|uniref:SIR2 family protein n=1 Tax=Aliifodinibius sp. S!AR15-10 TaxID=2950437 RepID=UPI002861A4CA|nr:SIR2 family protein [Aliifodinibius sp. S!AR15-10]MDR8389506.1 SIR2 family protein [Aliifodinibius sp. S!AR15-10]